MLTQLRVINFKSWEDTGEIGLKPITGFFGPNSSGKTSLFQALLLMKQTVDSSNKGVVFLFGDETKLVNLGDFDSVIREHDTGRTLEFSLGWQTRSAVRIPEAYKSGWVNEGDNVGFEVEIGKNVRGSEKSLVLEEMAYEISDGRRFGMRCLQDPTSYEVFVSGMGIEFTRMTREPVLHSRQSNFFDFPYWAEEQFDDRNFVFDLKYGLVRQFEDMHYVGPLRTHPKRIYHWSGSEPLGVGTSGESVVDCLLSSRVGLFEKIGANRLTLEEYVAKWLTRLGLVHDFRVERIAEGRPYFEVKVRKTPESAEVLLSDVGFGVSQVLPVLVQCFYLPEGSTLILEQPDIHLHPSVQAGLADVFIDAWKERRVQILFESHSEHLLRRLQRRIAEEDIQQEKVGLFFCSTRNNGTSSLNRLEVDGFGNISNWPSDFFGDQFGEIAAMSSAALRRQGEAE